MTPFSISPSAIAEYVGKRCRIRCRVVETRKSGHVGDLFHGIKPTTPSVGEVVDLGVGLLVRDADWGADDVGFLLDPGDGRAAFWMDPRKLYRLHDQTVEVFAELTVDPPDAVADIGRAEPGAVGVEGEGMDQVKGRPVVEFERLGDGLFSARRTFRR